VTSLTPYDPSFVFFLPNKAGPQRFFSGPRGRSLAGGIISKGGRPRGRSPPPRLTPGDDSRLKPTCEPPATVHRPRSPPSGPMVSHYEHISPTGPHEEIFFSLAWLPLKPRAPSACSPLRVVVSCLMIRLPRLGASWRVGRMESIRFAEPLPPLAGAPQGIPHVSPNYIGISARKLSYVGLVTWCDETVSGSMFIIAGPAPRVFPCASGLFITH